MATITLVTTALPGPFGPIPVDLRSASPRTPLPVVLLHGGSSDDASWTAFAGRLAKAGFHAVTLATGDDELADLAAVVHALHGGALGIPVTSLGVVGSAGGSAAALQLARQEPLVTALATWSAEPLDDASPLAAPWLREVTGEPLSPAESERLVDLTTRFFIRQLG